MGSCSRVSISQPSPKTIEAKHEELLEGCALPSPTRKTVTNIAAAVAGNYRRLMFADNRNV